MPFRLNRFAALLLALSLLLAATIAFDWLPVLRGGEIFRWQWPHNPVDLRPALRLGLAVTLYALIAYGLIGRQRPIWVLLWALIGSGLLPLMVIGLRNPDVLGELFLRAASPVATGRQYAAALIDWSGAGWRDWPATMTAFRETSIHVALSPPGLVLLYGGVQAIFDALPGLSDALYRALLPYQCHNFTLLTQTPAEWASAVFAMLMPLWAALTVIPLYAVGRYLGNERAARLIALLWALIPAAAMFTPTFNTLYPLFAVIAFWLLLRGYDARRGGPWWLASGLVTGLLTFANLSLVPLAGLFGFYALLRTPHRPRLRPVIVGAWFGVGALLPWGLWWLLTGDSPLVILQTAFNQHLTLDRPYLPWLWLHFWEWALLAGVPLVMVWLWAAVRRLVRDPLALALLLTLVVLLLSNTARGETARVWLFFTPFVLLIAAQALSAQKPTANDRALEIALLIGQAALCVALVTTWDVIDAPDMTSPPTPPPAHVETRPVDALYDDRLRLVGWSAQTDADTLTLFLNWQPVEQITTPYFFAALPVAPDGTPAQVVVWQPDDTRTPATCWPSGAVVGDVVQIPLPDDAAPGDWFISLSAFTDPDNALATNVTVQMPDGRADTQIGLGPVPVAP